MTYLNTTLITLLAATALSVPAFAADSPVLEIKNFIGTIDVVNSDQEQIRVIDAKDAKIDQRGNSLIIDYDQIIKNANCKSTKANVSIEIGKRSWSKRTGYKDLSEYPKLRITAPADAHLIIKDSVIFGDFADFGSADIHVRSCGDITVGDVAGRVDLKISGSGDVELADAGSAKISVSGSGDLDAGNFGATDIDISGSGDVEIEDINGDVRIESGGAGDISIGKIRGNLDYDGGGSSDVEVGSVNGDFLKIRSSGSGDVDIHKGTVETLEIRASGASEVYYGGLTVDAKAHASGASDVTIRRPSGALEMSDSGAADVNVGG